MTSNKNVLFFVYFIILFIIGSFGFYLIGGREWSLVDSIYMTVITLSTVGFTEVHPLGDTGRIWAMIIIIFGVIGVGILFSSLRDAFMHLNTFRRIKMMKKINKLQGHFIILGYGRMGEVIAKELSQKGQTFVVVEKDDRKAEKIIENGMYCIHGDATLDETLVAARVDNAGGIAVVLDTDQDNLFVTMSIRTMNSDTFLLSRCIQDHNKSKLLRSGADKVVNPYIAGGHRMAEMLLRPQIEDSVTLSTPTNASIDLNIDEISLNKLDRYDGIMIKDSRLREDYGLMIIGIIKEKGDNMISPDPHTVLNISDTILIMGSKKSLDNFKETLPII